MHTNKEQKDFEKNRAERFKKKEIEKSVLLSGREPTNAIEDAAEADGVEIEPIRVI